MLRLFCCITLLLFGVAEPKSSNPEEYIAVVVQYTPITIAPNFDEIPLINANNYEEIIKISHDLNADIIVFPEFGLTGLNDRNQEVFEFTEFNADPHTNFLRVKPTKHHISLYITEMRLKYKRISSLIPSPKENIILCNDTSHKYALPLRKISCAARNYRMYVVVNYPEYFIVDQNDLNIFKNLSNQLNPVEQVYHLYNTNVVFDRNGRIVARYRKSNLSYEPWMDTPIKKNLMESVFTTDFGITFGQLIGMDITMISASQFFKWYPNVQNIILTTRQYEIQPFLSSVQDAASWAYETNVKLLVAGTSWDGGCCIYLGNQGPLRATHNMNTLSNMILYANLHKNVEEKIVSNNVKPNMGNVQYLPQTNIMSPLNNVMNNSWTVKNIYEVHSQLIPDKTGRSIAKLCLTDGSLCCEFAVTVLFNHILKDTKHYWYHMIIFQSLYRSGHSYSIANSCAVVACTDSSKETCGNRFDSDKQYTNPTTFQDITIRAFAKSDGKMLLPIAKETERIMIAGIDHVYETFNPLERNQKEKFMDLVLKKSTKYLTIFGVVDRIYDESYAQNIDTINYRNVFKFAMHTVLTLILASVVIFILIIFKQSSEHNYEQEISRKRLNRGVSLPHDFGRGSWTFGRKNSSELRNDSDEDDNQ